jgi:hypothetical protein
MDQFWLSFRCITGGATPPSDPWRTGYAALREVRIGLYELALKQPVARAASGRECEFAVAVHAWDGTRPLGDGGPLEKRELKRSVAGSGILKEVAVASR